MALLKDHPRLGILSVRQPATVLALVRHLKVYSLRHFLDTVPQAPLESTWSSLLEGLSRQRLCSVLPILLNEVEVHPTLAAVMSEVEPNNLIQILSRIPPGHLRAVCKVSPTSLIQLLSHLEPGKVLETVIPLLLEPQEIIERSLVPVLAKVQAPERLANIINLVDKEVLLHLLRNVDGEHLATLVNAFQDDKEQSWQVTWRFHTSFGSAALGGWL